MKKNNPTVKNKQWQIFRNLMIISMIFFVIMILPFMEGNPLSERWFAAFLGIFLTLSFFIAALIFRNRAKKMDKLLQNISLIAEWDMDKEMKMNYVNAMRSAAKKKNNAVMWIVGIFFVVISIPFVFMLEDDERGVFLAIMGSVLAIVFVASKFFPWYYYKKNLKGDGKVMIGEKFAYFNGYFHNWDYPLSGLSKVKMVKEPFRGLLISYYYTDLTLVHSHTIRIPVPEKYDPARLIEQLKLANKRR